MQSFKTLDKIYTNDQENEDHQESTQEESEDSFKGTLDKIYTKDKKNEDHQESTQEESEDSFKDALDENKDHQKNNQEEFESLSQCLRNRNTLTRPVRFDDSVMVAE